MKFCKLETRSRRDSWTDEMREHARQVALGSKRVMRNAKSNNGYPANYRISSQLPR